MSAYTAWPPGSPMTSATWKVVAQQSFVNVRDVAGHVVCTVSARWTKDGQRDLKAEADTARVLAAAPELVDSLGEAAAALAACVDVMRDMRIERTATVVQAQHDKCVALLAKVRGTA